MSATASSNSVMYSWNEKMNGSASCAPGSAPEGPHRANPTTVTATPTAKTQLAEEPIPEPEPVEEITEEPEALVAGVAPPVLLAATHSAALDLVSLDDLEAHAIDPVA